MGIKFFPLGILPCIRLSISRTRKLVQIVEKNGKVIEFTSPLLVKELLINFEGFLVKSSRKSSINLPPSFKLQMGKKYYLFPCEIDHNLTAGAESERPVKNSTTAVKRIKVVITKKQLQELLLNKASVEKIILGIRDKSCFVNSAVSWNPSLVPIPEENELINV